MLVTLDTLENVLFDLKKGDRIFLKGKLGAGKTTFAQALIRRHLQDNILNITSPTYIYYQKYGNNLYHFDCYRIEHPSDITRIGAEEIFDDPDSICLIEWPEKLDGFIKPTKVVELTETSEGREINIRNS